MSSSAETRPPLSHTHYANDPATFSLKLNLFPTPPRLIYRTHMHRMSPQQSHTDTHTYWFMENHNGGSCGKAYFSICLIHAVLANFSPRWLELNKPTSTFRKWTDGILYRYAVKTTNPYTYLLCGHMVLHTIHKHITSGSNFVLYANVSLLLLSLFRIHGDDDWLNGIPIYQSHPIPLHYDRGHFPPRREAPRITLSAHFVLNIWL